MQVIETQPNLERKILRGYPQLADRNEFGLLQRLTARIDTAKIGNGLFLGYCKTHKKYYKDHKHTNGGIRCPICDEKWLIEHGFTKNKLEK